MNAEHPEWTIDELAELVRGKTIVARDVHARSVPVPAELRVVAQHDERPWEDQISQDHAEWFGTIVKMWSETLDAPGTVRRATLKRRVGATWFAIELAMVSLLHQPEFGFVLVATHVVGETTPPEDTPAERSAAYTSPYYYVQDLDEGGIILHTEGDVEEVFGLSADALVGRNGSELVHADDRDALIAMWREVVAAPDNARTIQHRLVRPNGTAIWIQSVILNRLASNGCVHSVSHDISEQRAQQAALAASEEELRFLAEAVPVAVFRLSGAGAVRFSNYRWDSLLGAAKTFDDVLALVEEDDRPLLSMTLKDAQHGSGSEATTVRMLGNRRHLEFRLQAVGDPSNPERGFEVIGTVDDVTSGVLRTVHLEATAELDPLTGVANRRGLTRKLDAALTGPGSTLVLFGDLDGFKQVNDQWGHDAGDRVLIAIGHRLQDAVRPNDIVGRWGGDEFVIVCEDVPDGDEDDVIARLHHALSTDIPVDDHHYRARVSLGAVRPQSGEQSEDVLRRADTAMYEAKRVRHQR